MKKKSRFFYALVFLSGLLIGGLQTSAQTWVDSSYTFAELTEINRTPTPWDTLLPKPLNQADSFLNFIAKNKPRVAFYLSRNDTSLAAINEDKPMPLAQIPYVLIAIEFAKQAGNGVFDENFYVAINDLNHYYLPISDSDAHIKWLEYEKQQNNILNDSVRITDVVRGMTMFNSDANAEFLTDFLGFENIKENLNLFGFKTHTEIYSLVASLFLYQTSKKLDSNTLVKNVKKLSDKNCQLSNNCRGAGALHGKS
ncbi:MAG: hypothetical protein HY305_07295 [Sphingobacteriales bacterium]|nr:hypothetical protein [Sphingobacteriales bacterium]